MLDARKGFRADDPLRALGIRAQPAALDEEARRAIAERLLLGDPDEAILAEQARAGADLALVRAEIAAARAHPYVRAAERLRARLAKRDWLLACRARLEGLALDAVPRRDRLDAETFFAEHYATLTPVVLTGLVDHWPGLGWTLDGLLAKVGNPEVEVQTGREGDPEFELNSISHKTRMPFAEVIERLRADPETNDFYVTANNTGLNRKALAPLWADVGDLPGYLAPGPLGDGFFWMGPRGTVTPWHHDLTQNLLVNMVGVKRVELVSPAETPAMANHRHCFSAFGADATLGGASVRRLTVEIGPGEILFIPVGWWHHVTGRTLTIGMSFTNFAWPNDFARLYSTEGFL
ncbi:MAG: cupin-like domain-containing protein [Sphingomonadaceae bacterium]